MSEQQIHDRSSLHAYLEQHLPLLIEEYLSDLDDFENMKVPISYFNSWDLPVSMFELQEILGEDYFVQFEKDMAAEITNKSTWYPLFEVAEMATLDAFRNYACDYCNENLIRLAKDLLMEKANRLPAVITSRFFQYDIGTCKSEILQDVIKLTADKEGSGTFLLGTGLSIAQLIEAEFNGVEGDLGRTSTTFESELADMLNQASAVIQAMVEQIRDYSDNEWVIGKANSYHLNDIVGLLGIEIDDSTATGDAV